MFDLSQANWLSAQFDLLISESTEVDGSISREKLVGCLKEKLMDGCAVQQTVAEEEIPVFPVFVENGEENLGPDAITHALAFTVSMCMVAGLQTRRARKALYHAIACVYVLWKNLNHLQLNQIFLAKLGEKYKESKQLSQMVRCCFNIVNLKEGEPSFAEINATNNDAVAEHVRIIREVDSAHKNDTLKLTHESIKTVTDYLSSGQRTKGKSDHFVMGQMLAELKPEKDDDPKPKPKDEDSPKDEVADPEGDPEADAEPEPEVSKAEHMLLGAPSVPLEALLNRHGGPGAIVMVCFVADANGSMAPVGAIPCDSSTAKAVYEAIQADGPTPGMSVVHDFTVSASALKSRSSAENQSALMAVNPGGIVSSITGSSVDTGSRVIVTPTTEFSVPSEDGGDFVADIGFDFPSKLVNTAFSENDALLRVDPNITNGFDARITVPRVKEIVIPFVPYGDQVNDLRFDVAEAGKLPWTTDIVLSPEELVNLREFHAVPFLKSEKKLQAMVIKVCASGSQLSLERIDERAIALMPATIAEQGGDVAEIMAVDFFKSIDRLRAISIKHDANIRINAAGYVWIRAFSEHAQIDFLIPPASGNSPVVADVQAVADVPHEQPKLTVDKPKRKRNRKPAVNKVSVDQAATDAPEAPIDQ